MKLNKESLLLYLVTDRSWLGENTLISEVKTSLINGVTFLQLREKNLDEESFLKLAIEMKELAEEYHVPFVINDNVHIAAKSNAHGVHIGQDDIAIEEARRTIGEDKILGVSVGTVEEAVLAEKLGADYLGVGAMFSTNTKGNARDTSIETLKDICEAVKIPVVAIGGIKKENISLLKDSGIHGVAVVSAILAQKDISKATWELKEICEGTFQ